MDAITLLNHLLPIEVLEGLQASGGDWG